MKKFISITLVLMAAAWLFAASTGITLTSAQSFSQTDLSVTKSGPDTIAPGANISYTITVVNFGPDVGVNAQVTDPLPAGVTFVSVSAPSGWVCSTPSVGTNGTVTCSNPSFAVSPGQVFTLVGQVSGRATPGTFISNSATISSSTPDVNPENDTSTSSALIMGATADLSVTKVASADTITADSDLTYTITVTNGGPDTATAATLTDPLQLNLTFVSLARPAGWTCSPLTPGSGGTLSCSRDLPANSGPQVFTLVTHIPSGTPNGTFYNNMATVSTTTNDPTSENDVSTAGTMVGCVTDPIVTNNADSGAGSLRQAIKDACAGSTITFSSVVSPITLTTAELLIDKNLTINGTGANALTVQRSAAGPTPQFRVFNIQSGATVKISGLTISGGSLSSANGSGILNDGSLTLANVAVSNNTATNANGGGIFNSGSTLNLIGSTVNANVANGGSGAGLYASAGTITFTNSTVSGNDAHVSGATTNPNPGQGGGIFNNGGTLSLTNSTVSSNLTAGGGSGSVGGGVYNAGGTTDLKNTIVANNSGANGPDLFGTFNSQDYNLLGNTTGATFTGTTTHNIVNQSANLGALANNGGPTQTMLPQPNSPAINAAPPANLPVDTFDVDGDSNTAELLPLDQRGFARVVGANFDIGAVETNYAISATAGTPQNTPANSAFSTAMKATVTEAGTPKSGISVTFTAPGSGASGSFPGSSLTAVVATDINGVATAPTFTANAIGGSYNVVASIGTGLPTANFALTNNKLNQTISFAQPADKTFGNADFTVTATATSGLSVTFAASGNCTVTTTGTVHLTGAGSCTITASQAGNATYNAAPDVARTFNILKATTTTTVTSSVNPSAIGQSVTFTATVTSAAGTPTGTVQFKDNGVNLGGPVTLAGGVATLTTSTLTAGTHPITADYSGDGNFNVSTGTLSGGQIVGVALIFSAATYDTTESSRSVTITVQRIGDPSVAVTVDYATPDDSSQTPTILPCSTAGFVSPRCDFTTMAGTLRFAAGDTVKTFDVLISQDNYVEGSESFPVTLSNPTNGAVLGTPSTANVIIADDVTEPTANPIDDSTNFVRQHYHDFLNREPLPGDAAGLNYWVNQIESCGSDQACRDLKRQNVSGAFFLSVEFQQTGYYVYRTYKTAFGDINPPTVPVPVRFREFITDTQEVQRGVVVGQGAWQTQIDANKQAYALAFVNRSSFLARYPGITSATAFVDTLNANAGNVLTPSERNAYISQLSSKPSDPAQRADVLMKIAENAVLKQQEMNRGFVLMQYFGYLRRNPDAAPEPGLNFGGFNFWLNKLNQFNGNFVSAEMVKAFINSAEYRRRFGQN